MCLSVFHFHTQFKTTVVQHFFWVTFPRYLLKIQPVVRYSLETCILYAYEVDTGRCSNRGFVLNSQTIEGVNPFAVTRMFERDFSEEFIPGLGLSKKTDDSSPSAGKELPNWKMAIVNRPCPWRLRMLFFLTTVFQRFIACFNSKDYSWPTEATVTFMENMIENGFVKKVKQGAFSLSDTEQGNVWCFPHHGVYHPNKISVVFDCAAEFKGESLNKLLQGLDLTNSLTGILNRLHQEHVALMCDIESMFYQGYVAEEYRDLLRFLWWENCELRIGISCRWLSAEWLLFGWRI